MKINSCGKVMEIEDGEPIFVIRGNDLYARIVLNLLMPIYYKADWDDILALFDSWQQHKPQGCHVPD